MFHYRFSNTPTLSCISSGATIGAGVADCHPLSQTKGGIATPEIWDGTDSESKELKVDGGQLRDTGDPLTDEGGLLTDIGGTMTDIGGPLADTGGPWQNRWPSG